MIAEATEILEHLKMKNVLLLRSSSQVGEPPRSLVLGMTRAEKKGKKAIHKCGQGGSHRLQAEFVRNRGRKALRKEVKECMELGVRAVMSRLDEDIEKSGFGSSNESQGEEPKKGDKGNKGPAPSGSKDRASRASGAKKVVVNDSQAISESSNSESEIKEVVKQVENCH
ncbi:unnamed protein product [Calypogeia fissa]